MLFLLFFSSVSNGVQTSTRNGGVECRNNCRRQGLGRNLHGWPLLYSTLLGHN
ncbi:hypothetical protein CsSME_00002049 [Camellia sinensis var. sinensis]